MNKFKYLNLLTVNLTNTTVHLTNITVNWFVFAYRVTNVIYLLQQEIKD